MIYRTQGNFAHVILSANSPIGRIRTVPGWVDSSSNEPGIYVNRNRNRRLYLNARVDVGDAKFGWRAG